MRTSVLRHFTSFQDHPQAETLLQQACRCIEQYPEELDVVRATSTAYHYLGRLVELRGDLSEAIRLYVLSKDYQDRCPEELGATAFIHLRMGELLTYAHAFDQAHDHLLESHRLFRVMRDRGSGWAQVHLGFAMLEAALGHHKNADYNLRKALQISRDCGFLRGELLCIGLLVSSQLRSFRLLSAAVTFSAIVIAALREQWHSGNRRTLLSKALLSLSVLARRMGNLLRAKRTAQQPETVRCPCPLHHHGP